MIFQTKFYFDDLSNEVQIENTQEVMTVEMVKTIVDHLKKTHDCGNKTEGLIYTSIVVFGLPTYSMDVWVSTMTDDFDTDVDFSQFDVSFGEIGKFDKVEFEMKKEGGS
jgi:hypothetical protein